jgi:hypothetical protein
MREDAAALGEEAVGEVADADGGRGRRGRSGGKEGRRGSRKG